MKKLTYERHLSNVAVRRGLGATFDDFKVIKLPDGVKVQCRHPNCHLPLPPERGGPKVKFRPRKEFPSLAEARDWARQHAYFNHRQVTQ